MAFVLCIDNTGYPASLRRRRRYRVVRDASAERHGLLRIIDESGDSYLYPTALFKKVAFPQSIAKAMESGFEIEAGKPSQKRTPKSKSKSKSKKAVA